MSNQAPAPAALPADYEHILALLRERDRLILGYVAVLPFSDEQYSEWHRATWKSYARNQLALIKAVRPVTFTDYRNRIKILSPTFGVYLPHLVDLVVTGWMLESEAQEQLRREEEQLQRESDSSAALLALFGEEEPPAEPLYVPAKAMPLLALPLFVEPETPEPAPLPPVVEEPPMSIEEFHAAPDFKGVFLAPTATVEEVERLVQGLFSWNGEALGEDNPTLGELYQRKRALLLTRSAAPSSAMATPADDAERLAAIELRKRNRAKLQADNPTLANALNAPIFNTPPVAKVDE